MKPSPAKKITASFVLIIASIAYVAYLNLGSSEEFSATNQKPKTAAAPSTEQPAAKTATAPAPSQTPKASGLYADGTYTGSAADAYYGTVQVQASVSGGKLTDVTFLQYPNDRGTSRRISEQTMPILKTEAIRAQSANVDIVSGATELSTAFRQSLSSALAQAAN